MKFDTASLLIELWAKAGNHLTLEELQYFSTATSCAELITANLKNSLESIGCVLRQPDIQKEIADVMDPSGFGAVLFSVADSLAAIHAMMVIGSEASDMLPLPDTPADASPATPRNPSNG